MQEQKRKKQNKNMNKGVTLIALVVTIIVLLILAGVTITAVTGRKGIIQEATTAKEKSEKADLEEQIDIAIIQAEGENTNTTMNDVIQKLLENGIIESADKVNQKTGDIITKKPSYLITGKLDDYIVAPPGKPNTETGIFTENSTINGGTASYHNPEIPKGFKPVDVGAAVWGDGTSAPAQEAVNAGLVIEDDLGNQFVWIPVDGGLYNGTLDTTKVQLGRYVFKEDGSIDTTLSQSTSEGQLNISTYPYTEGKKDETTGNIHAKDIEGFKTSVANHGGYYIARYEASKGAKNKPASKVSTGTPATSLSITISEGMLWSNITQLDAAIACQNMYDSNYGVTSDLMNSYAWDTAIIFMQKYGTNPTYSRQTGKNPSSANTGVNEDEQCHVHDMASNCWEWTTETYGYAGQPCNYRGGVHDDSYYCTSSRLSSSTTNYSPYIVFRTLLYL